MPDDTHRDHRTTGANASRPSIGRVLGTALVAAVAFVPGFYAGLVVLLSVAGWSELSDGEFEFATVPAGGLFAGLAATAVGPGRFRSNVARVTGATVVAALAAALSLRAIGGDFAIAIVLGGVVAVVVATISAAVPDPRPGG